MLLVASLGAQAQDLELKRGGLVAGGGLGSGGGGLTLSGALGQWESTEIGALSGTSIVMSGGFWVVAGEPVEPFPDEPSAVVSLETDPDLSCPGFYVLRTHAGPGSEAGRFGAELNLTGSGRRTLQGGLNFGGRATNSVRGFSAFNIANSANEQQEVNIEVTVGAPGQLSLERRSGGNVVATPIDTTVPSGSSQHTAVVDPGFYVVAFTPETSESTSYLVSALTSYVDRSGGGFQGGVVVGGFHDPERASGSSESTGFAGFCIAEDRNVVVEVLSRPTYGSSGSTSMAFSLSRGGEVVYDSRD
ncbi:MAG: hypothetical protein EA370_13630 [Wenzhouxiangella sp.]|nr:MAG: hypothetical protein EA370_13630 [Wenzhouxiangella sp.]